MSNGRSSLKNGLCPPNAMIITVGEEPKPIYEGLRRKSNMKLLIFIASESTRSYAEKYREEFRNMYESDIFIINPSDLNSVLSALLEVHKKYPDRTFIYNITGGTKIMSLACFIFAMFNNEDVFYIFKKGDEEMILVDLPIVRNDLKKFLLTSKKHYEVLSKIPDEGIYMSDLKNIFNISKPTMIAYIDRLESYGLINTYMKKRRKFIKISKVGILMRNIISMNKIGGKIE